MIISKETKKFGPIKKLFKYTKTSQTSPFAFRRVVRSERVALVDVDSATIKKEKFQREPYMKVLVKIETRKMLFHVFPDAFETKWSQGILQCFYSF